MISILAFLAALVIPQEPDTAAGPTLTMTNDPDQSARCLNGMAGFSGVRMQCVVDERGRARDCTVMNPNPRIMRHERVFQCMASTMRFSMSDGSSPEGAAVVFGLGGQTLLGEERLRQAREEARRQP